MWVIWNGDTGEEIERVETVEERNTAIAFHESEWEDQGTPFYYRWEA